MEDKELLEVLTSVLRSEVSDKAKIDAVKKLVGSSTIINNLSEPHIKNPYTDPIKQYEYRNLVIDNEKEDAKL